MSIERHSRARQIELGKSLASRKKIYLDARFWIFARNAALGDYTEPAARKLLHYLRRGVAAGQLVCPISASTFLELMKQPYSPGRRIGTAAVIDELSLGVSMIPSRIVMGTETNSLLLKAQGADLHPMQELVWTKVAYTLGDIYPTLEGLSADRQLEIQKAFFDELWTKTVTDIVTTMGDNVSKPDGFEDLSKETNRLNAEHKDELRSFAHTYDTELRGAIEDEAERAADIIHQLAEKNAGRELIATPEERAESVKMCCNLLYHAFKKPETKATLRGLHITASIHAAMRWDKERKFRPNDYYDFEHATAALSYCDAFFTEGPLHDLVSRADLELEAVNGCRVFSDIALAADHTRQLLNSD